MTPCYLKETIFRGGPKPTPHRHDPLLKSFFPLVWKRPQRSHFRLPGFWWASTGHGWEGCLDAPTERSERKAGVGVSETKERRHESTGFFYKKMKKVQKKNFINVSSISNCVWREVIVFTDTPSTPTPPTSEGGRGCCPWRPALVSARDPALETAAQVEKSKLPPPHPPSLPAV